MQIQCELVCTVIAVDQFLQEGRCKDKIVQVFVFARQNLVFAATPRQVAFVDEADVFSNFHHRVHVVGIDNGGDVVVFGNIGDQLINGNRSLRIKA